LFVLLLSANCALSASISDPLETDMRRDATVRAIEIALPSVVNIATATIVERAGDPMLENFRRYFGWRVPTEKHEEPYSIGSGVIVDEEGYILTNFHVLQRATRAQVKLWDGRLYEVESQYVASPDSDLALLKLRTKPGEKFRAIKFAPDDDLLLGETVIALGNPFGLGGSVSRGILSSKNRRPPVEDEPLDIQDWLQTDAAINPGNSGGPLINLRAELIGVNNQRGQGPGIGFAIPTKQIGTALSEMLSPESTDSLWFGARIKSGSAPLQITAVQSGSPADKAGLRAGQEILQVNGSAPRSLVDFNRLIVSAKDHSATLKLQQGSESLEKKIQLVPFDDVIQQKLGLVLLNPTSESAGAGKGLVVLDVEKNGPADRAQLQRGFILTGIDGKSANNLMAVASALAEKKPGASAQLTVVVPRRLSGNFDLQGNVNVQVR
jgi:serine protease Do